MNDDLNSGCGCGSCLELLVILIVNAVLGLFILTVLGTLLFTVLGEQIASNLTATVVQAVKEHWPWFILGAVVLYAFIAYGLILVRNEREDSGDYY